MTAGPGARGVGWFRRILGPGAHGVGWFRRILVSVLLLGLLGYGSVAGYLFFAQSRMVFHPKPGLDTTPEAWGMRYENVFFDSQGQRLHGWWIPGDPEKPVILFFHGNASVLSGLKAHAELFRRQGLGLFLFDYRGYGQSEGEPSEDGLYADSLAAYAHLSGPLKIAPARIVYFGHSLGGGAATWLALRHSPRALILEGTFLSIPAVGEDRYPYLPIRLLSRIRFDNLERIRALCLPLLIIHSQDDEVIAPHHGRALFEAAACAPRKSYLETRGRHNVSFNQGGALAEEGLRRFLASVP
ncbi:MAG: alpha/beta hydrolase [Magnetococcales bacterium]|nr:alpha/beta hydrolase [Magnetococcales bacterium]